MKYSDLRDYYFCFRNASDIHPSFRNIPPPKWSIFQISKDALVPRAPQSDPNKKKVSSSINQACKILFLELLSKDCSDFHQISGYYSHWILLYFTGGNFLNFIFVASETTFHCYSERNLPYLVAMMSRHVILLLDSLQGKDARKCPLMCVKKSAPKTQSLINLSKIVKFKT